MLPYPMQMYTMALFILCVRVSFATKMSVAYSQGQLQFALLYLGIVGLPTANHP